MIFKKHISILLTAFLLVSNLGLAFNVHYCDNEIASVTISTIPATAEVIDECCGIVEKDSQCCNDKVIKAEIKSDQIIVPSLLLDFIAVTDYWTPQFFTLNNNFQQRDTFTYYCDAHAPPLYLLYSQYTFYC
ncbi:HYC_CC_PP family protein [Flavobacterium wongokense]|uniref:HYC_CC_PP family protein n=1 Tax=Flavobacterium wongokense TaxID=2910674 RepID=UPI001F2D2EB1|nr:hypothetical protein [Flavobacterium sp. WG47]MCF6130937.1 hypothetical protein [Flavobacterium sp. WG47]